MISTEKDEGSLSPEQCWDSSGTACRLATQTTESLNRPGSPAEFTRFPSLRARLHIWCEVEVHRRGTTSKCRLSKGWFILPSGLIFQLSLLRHTSPVVLAASHQAFRRRTQNVLYASQPVRAGGLEVPLIVVSWPNCSNGCQQ